ncbi:MAG: cytochrome P450 [Candidatus Binatia bacterium]
MVEPIAEMKDETREYFASPLEFFRKRRAQGGVIRSVLFGAPCYFLVGPKAHEFVHVSGRHLFSSAQAYRRVIESFGHGAIIAQDGKDWQIQHDIITPLFSPASLKRMFDIKQELYAARMAQWPGEGTVDLLHESIMLTIRGSLRAMFGLDIDPIVNEVRDCLITLGEIAFLTFGATDTAARVQETHRQLEAILGPQIDAKRKNPGEDGMSFYATKYDPPLSNVEILQHAAGLMFAAHDTTKSMMTWSFYLMLKYPEYRARVMQEVAEKVGSALTFTPVSLPNKLPVLDNLIKEAERMYTPLHPNSRVATEDFEFEGHHIPAGAIVQVDAFATHYDPAIFREPERFDPDRFAPPREEHKHSPYALLGFGGGERVCMGKPVARQDIKTALILAFQHYELEFVDKGEIEIVWGPMTQPKDGLKVSVRPKAS